MDELELEILGALHRRLERQYRRLSVRIELGKPCQKS